MQETIDQLMLKVVFTFEENIQRYEVHSNTTLVTFRHSLISPLSLEATLQYSNQKTPFKRSDHLLL